MKHFLLIVSACFVITITSCFVYRQKSSEVDFLGAGAYSGFIEWSKNIWQAINVHLFWLTVKFRIYPAATIAVTSKPRIQNPKPKLKIKT